jgi:hypothetical protein
MGQGTGDFGAFAKYRLGWLTTNEIAYATRSKDFVLDQLETSSAGKRALLVRTAQEEYWVENRRDPARTVDGQVVGPPGVLVRTGSPQGKEAPGVTDLSSYNRLIADPAGNGRPALLPGDRYALRGIFTLKVVSREGGRARLRFAWTDRTPPGRVHALAAALAAPEGTLKLVIAWEDPRESGSGIASFRVSLDRGSQHVVGHDPEATDANMLELARPRAGKHTVTVVAVDRAGNRSRPATLRFRS